MKLPVLAVPILRVSHRRPVPSHGVRKRRLEQVVILDQQHLHGDTQACAHMQAKRQEPPSVKKMKKTGLSGIFAASLELTREGAIKILQEKIFEKIMIKKTTN